MSTKNPDLTNKLQLRRHFRQQRICIKKENRQIWSRQIADRVLALPQFADAHVIFSYLANWGEVATNLIIIEAMSQRKLVLTPTPDHKALPENGFHYVQSEHDGGILTAPYHGSVGTEQIDLFLVPGIVWDRTGHRIGFGGGYFDRLLSAKRPDAYTVGLSYDLQLIDKVPQDPWDQPVNILVTQSSQTDCNTSV